MFCKGSAKKKDSEKHNGLARIDWLQLDGQSRDRLSAPRLAITEPAGYRTAQGILWFLCLRTERRKGDMEVWPGRW